MVDNENEVFFKNKDDSDNNNKSGKNIDLIYNTTFNILGKKKFLHIVIGDEERYDSRNYDINERVKKNRFIFHCSIYTIFAFVFLGILILVLNILGLDLGLIWSKVIVNTLNTIS